MLVASRVVAMSTGLSPKIRMGAATALIAASPADMLQLLVFLPGFGVSGLR